MAKRHGPLLRAINDNRLPRFAGGGPVGDNLVPFRGLRRSPQTDAAARTNLHFHVDASNSIMASDLIAQMQRIGTVAMIGGS